MQFDLQSFLENARVPYKALWQIFRRQTLAALRWLPQQSVTFRQRPPLMARRCSCV